MEEYIKKFKDDGYCIIKNFVSKEFCNKSLEWLANYKDFSESDYELYTNLVLVYRNILTEDSPFCEIKDNEILKEFSKKLNIDNVDYFFPRVYNKSKFNGQPVNYHQELFYNKNYGYKFNGNEAYQIFVALEKHDENNACLNVVPKSHLSGCLQHDDFIDIRLFQKSRVNSDILESEVNKNGFVKCILEPGDAVFFHQLTIHGSSSNASPLNRKVFASGVCDKKYVENYDSKIREDYHKERIRYTQKELNKILSNYLK